MSDNNSEIKVMKLSKFQRKLILSIIAGIFIVLAALAGRETYVKLYEKKRPQPLSLEGWSLWGGITVIPEGNTITINGTINQAGCFTTFVNTTMKNKKIKLKITNAANSEFDNGAMIKITANEMEISIKPINIQPLIYDEYVPSWEREIEFIAPMNFDGKLGFVFTQAKLNNLQITLFYSE